RAADCGKKMSSPRIIMIPRCTPYFAFIRGRPLYLDLTEHGLWIVAKR
ncbi:hypothetical protein SMU22_00160, partial [Streptococcus mutans 4SM1]